MLSKEEMMKFKPKKQKKMPRSCRGCYNFVLCKRVGADCSDCLAAILQGRKSAK